METTDLTINDYEYILGDTLSDRALLAEAEMNAEWEAIDQLIADYSQPKTSQS